MSSDDYIFVLQTPLECTCGGVHSHSDCPIRLSQLQNGDGWEYRIAHVVGAYWENEDEMFEEFSDSAVYYRKDKALVIAHELEDRASQLFPVEYGVKVIYGKQPFP